MKTDISEKAENIRDVIRYLQKFKNALVVIYLDDKTIESPLFSSHIKDIALLHEAGLQVAIVPGARQRIDQILSSEKIEWTYKNNIRITNQEAMPLIKMAAFDVSNTVMTSLAANNVTAIIGNWVRSRAKGVINGFDFGSAGEIDKLQTDAIKTVLNHGFIPIFPCIGWNSVGHPYNISSVSLAEQIAINLCADKLFFVINGANINCKSFSIPKNIATSENGDIPALNLEEVDEVLKENKKQSEICTILEKAKNACKNGVIRSHILDGSKDGVLPCEIFSNLGSGTMIYTSNYGKIRQLTQSDIPSVLAIMKPFIEQGILLNRTENEIAETMNDYFVYEIDGSIRGCASLHVYKDSQAEIGAVTVDSSYSHMGIGPLLINYLIDLAHSKKCKDIFIMTTQTIDWFEKLGFSLDSDINSLPEERLKKWSVKRNSKLLRYVK